MFSFRFSRVSRMNLKTFIDPSTNAGTARWATLGIALYDAARYGLNLTNGSVLLALAGIEIAARLFGGPKPPGGPAAAA